MTMSRKHFVAAAALGTAGAAIAPDVSIASAGGSSIHFHVLKPGEYDHARMTSTLATRKRHKQVFQSVTPIDILGTSSLYLHMQNSLNAFEFSYGMGPNALAVLAVLTGPSIVLALDDAMWHKYGFGKMFKLADTNTYYKASSLKANGNVDDPASIYQDWSAQAVLHRGGAFFVCHNAITAIAAIASQGAGMTPAGALADFNAHVLPGFQIVPAGVAATQLAADHGWMNYPVI